MATEMTEVLGKVVAFAVAEVNVDRREHYAVTGNGLPLVYTNDGAAARAIVSALNRHEAAQRMAEAIDKFDATWAGGVQEHEAWEELWEARQAWR